ncbi:hypothetical protein [Hydrogenophaga sp.]|uniref:hypothetical protein n=1 Tax=Hydrogenophaga sp. TaxID=1904254 RepID=UPI003F6C223C
MRNKKILKNILVLYMRQVFVVFVNLYAMRIVFNTLGIEDYGIYSVVAGFVTLLSFLPGTMASATQRFFSYALGQQDHATLKKTFSANWLLYAAIAVLAFIVLETMGLWYIREHLSIPPGRFAAAEILYHLTILSFVVSIFASPFIAILIAHEDMYIYAWISIAEAAMKLAAAILLTQLSHDKLELYGYLLLAVAVLNTALYLIICLRKYVECQFRIIYWDRQLAKNIIGFTGWTLFGQLTTVFRGQAITILINQFFSPATVAARAIAMTVAGQALIFSQHFNTGLYPPIIKTYAANQKTEMTGLVINGSKLTFFLMWVFALPMLLEMETILTLWLKTPPPEAVLFTQLALIESLILSLSLPLATAARAPGQMRRYELTLGSIQIAIFFCAWVALKAGYSAASVFIIAIVANVLMFKIRLLLVKSLVDIPLAPYYTKVFIPVSLIILLSTTTGMAANHWLPDTVQGSFGVVAICVTAASICMYFIGLDKHWRKKIQSMVTERLARARVAP